MVGVKNDPKLRDVIYGWFLVKIWIFKCNFEKETTRRKKLVSLRPKFVFKIIKNFFGFSVFTDYRELCPWRFGTFSCFGIHPILGTRKYSLGPPREQGFRQERVNQFKETLFTATFTHAIYACVYHIVLKKPK